MKIKADVVITVKQVFNTDEWEGAEDINELKNFVEFLEDQYKNGHGYLEDMIYSTSNDEEDTSLTIINPQVIDETNPIQEEAIKDIQIQVNDSIRDPRG